MSAPVKILLTILCLLCIAGALTVGFFSGIVVLIYLEGLTTGAKISAEYKNLVGFLGRGSVIVFLMAVGATGGFGWGIFKMWRGKAAE